MSWLIILAGVVLLMSGVLGQVYSLKTKRGVLPHNTRIGRRLVRAALVCAGVLLIALGAGRILLHPGSPIH